MSTVSYDKKEVHSQEELNRYFSSGDRCLVCYYASWCPHCIDMEPEWVRLCEKVGRYSLPIHVLKIEQSNIDDPSIVGYPTIQYVHKDRKEGYGGQRTMDELYSFVKERVMCPKCKKIML